MPFASQSSQGTYFCDYFIYIGGKKMQDIIKGGLISAGAKLLPGTENWKWTENLNFLLRGVI